MQLCTDLDTMPIEDASVRWPERPRFLHARCAHHRASARGMSEARSTVVDDGFAFSAFHGLAAHRPLGSLMRARKAAYAMSARFRAEHNKHAVEGIED